jgi:hypothetical protein
LRVATIRRIIRKNGEMMRWLLALFALLMPVVSAAAPDPAARYAAGQVWEYRTRPADKGSLLKIHSIEPSPTGEIYHISLIGLAYGRGMVGGGVFGHMPVSRETLDKSVTRLSDSKAAFPDPTEGIAQWRTANGGVFTIPIAEIIDGVMATITNGAVAADQ